MEFLLFALSLALIIHHADEITRLKKRVQMLENHGLATSTE